MFFLHLKIRDFAKNFRSSEIWERWEKKKKIFQKIRAEERAKRSSPDGQFDFLLDFCLAERRSVFKVCFTTSPQADQGGKAEVPRSGTSVRGNTFICTGASAEQRQLEPWLFPCIRDRSVGTVLGLRRNGKEAKDSQPSPPRHTHHCLLIYMTNALCVPFVCTVI